MSGWDGPAIEHAKGDARTWEPRPSGVSCTIAVFIRRFPARADDILNPLSDRPS